MGGPGHSDALQTLVCGTGYNQNNPTATVVAGFMSRLAEPDKVSMQFVQAARALPLTQLRVRPGQSAAVAQLVESSWAWGAITPYPPYDTFSELSLGQIPSTRIELNVANNPTPIADVPLAAVFVNSDITADDIPSELDHVSVYLGS